MAWLNDILNFVKSDYLSLWWLLVAGYLVCYGLAWILASAGRQGSIAQRCRQAWAWSFALHFVAVVALAILWWQKFGVFRSFYVFLSFYVVLGLIDLILAAKLFTGSRAVTSS